MHPGASRVFAMLNRLCCFQFAASETFVAFQLQIVTKKLDSLDTLYRMHSDLTRTIRGVLDWQKSDEKAQTRFFRFFIFSIASNHTWTRFSETAVVFESLFFRFFLLSLSYFESSPLPLSLQVFLYLSLFEPSLWALHFLSLIILSLSPSLSLSSRSFPSSCLSIASSLLSPFEFNVSLFPSEASFSPPLCLFLLAL